MIQIAHLSKWYGKNKVVDDVSFEVQPNTILGFLGRNGAGKSTTMNMITGYISADEGSIFIDGVDVALYPERAKQHMGYLPEIPPLYMDLTVGEYLRYGCAVKNVRKTMAKEHVDDICRQVDITHVRSRLIRNLSKGYRQRVGLANALVGNPKVLILDEPSAGLDPQQIIEMRTLIRTLRQGHTIILSSHILHEVKDICDEIAIIEKGRILKKDSVENLLNYDGEKRFTLKAAGSQQDVQNCLEETQGIKGIECVLDSESASLFEFSALNEKEVLEALFYGLAQKQCPILSLTPQKEELEDVFVRITAQREGD